MKKYRVWLFAVVSFLALAHAEAQDSGLWVNPNQFKAAPEEPAPPTPTEAGEKKAVYAIASAIGGQLNYIVAKQPTGSHADPYERATLPVPDYSLDAIVMRGIDRVVARRFPETDRVFMRLNPSQLEGVPPPDRERVAFERLTAELQKMPQRAHWDRIEAPWLIDEKINNTSSAAINIARSLTISGRLEVFAEKASSEALTRTLGGVVVPGEIKPVPPR